MHEKLLSYVLGDLDAQQTAEIEQELQNNPQLAAEVEKLRRCVGPVDELNGELNGDATRNTPSGLANRTADSVSLLIEELSSNPQTEPPTRRSSFSPLDVAVAIGVVAAVGMMLVPALCASREMARRNACANNLNMIGVALENFAEARAGKFPLPPPNFNVGSFTISLSNAGYIDRKDLAQYVVCPGSPEASLVSDGKLKVRIPSFDELEQLRGQALTQQQRVMALNVAYRLPYRSDQGVTPIEDHDSRRQPLLSDAPTIVDGQWRSLNHGGWGGNVRFQNGSVRFVSDFRDPVTKDHYFINTNGQPAMPTTPNDAVLVRSEYVPRIMALPVLFKVEPKRTTQPTPSPSPAEH